MAFIYFILLLGGLIFLNPPSSVAFLYKSVIRPLLPRKMTEKTVALSPARSASDRNTLASLLPALPGGRPWLVAKITRGILAGHGSDRALRTDFANRVGIFVGDIQIARTIGHGRVRSAELGGTGVAGFV